MSSCAIGIYTYHTGRRNGTLDRSSLVSRVTKGLAIFISTTALIVSLVQIVLIKSKWDHVQHLSSKGLILRWNTVIIAQITSWVVSFISQIVLYCFNLWPRSASQPQPISVSGPRDSVMSEMKVSRPSQRLHSIEPSRYSMSPAITSPTSPSSSPPSLKSFRDSIRHAVRPVTSRTTLISRSSVSREVRGINSQSMDNVSHSDGFDSWDTRDALVQTTSPEGMTLDPIPGSRPDSPARALDGPFPQGTLEEEDFEDLAPLPRMRFDTSRPSSPVVSEGHIHPLFRTETSSPAPEATPGTSILASPFANQAITRPVRPSRQGRSNSRPDSPSQLTHDKSFTRDRATSAPTFSRSSTPPSRGMTPPIPDFVLNSSPRSSMSGYRRVNLQYYPDR